MPYKGDQRVLRPVSGGQGASAGAWTFPGGGGTLAGAVADDVDTTYALGPTKDQANSGSIVKFSLTDPSIAANERIVQYRLRIKAKVNDTGGSTRRTGLYFQILRYGSIKVHTANYISYIPTITPAKEYYGTWFARDVAGGELTATNLKNTVARLIDNTPKTFTSGQRIRVTEVYLDYIVNRRPTLTGVGVINQDTTTRPTVQYTWNDLDGDVQNRQQVKVFPQAMATLPGFSPDTATPVYDSGDIATVDAEHQIGKDLVPGVLYRAYVRAAHSLGNLGNWWTIWSSIDFTIVLTPPPKPVLTMGAYDTVFDRALLLLQGRNNVLSADDASFSPTIGSWVGPVNCTVVRDTTQHYEGDACLKMTATAGGDMDARCGNQSGVVVGDTYTAGLRFRPDVTARSVRPMLEFVDGGGAVISPGGTFFGSLITETAAAWTEFRTVSGVAPAGAVSYRVKARVIGAAAAENHFVDTAFLGPGAGQSLRNGFEGADGTPVTVANSISGGDQLDAVSGTITYQTAKKVSGNSSMHSVLNNSSTSTASFRERFGRHADYTAEDFFQISGAPSVSNIRIYQESGDAGLHWGIAILQTTGEIVVRDVQVGVTRLATGIFPAASTWHRFLLRAQWDGTNVTVRLQLFLGANFQGTIPDYDGTSAPFAQSDIASSYGVGSFASSSVPSWNSDHDEFTLKTNPPDWGPGGQEGNTRYEMQYADMPRAGNILHPNIASGGEFFNTTDGWFPRNTSDQIAVSSEVPAYSGRSCIRWVPAATSSVLDIGSRSDKIDPYIWAALAGQMYEGGMRARTFSGSWTVRLIARFLDGAGMVLGSLDSGNVTVDTNWTDVSIPDGTAPLNTVMCRYELQNQAGIAGFPVFLDVPRFGEYPGLSTAHQVGQGRLLNWQPWRDSVDPITGEPDALFHWNDFVAQQQNTFYDYEVPVRELRLWRLRSTLVVSDVDLASEWTPVVQAGVTLAVNWLKHPLDPQLNFNPRINGLKPMNRTRPLRRGVHSIIGRSTPVVLTGQPASEKFQIQIVLETEADWHRFEEMLVGDGPLLLRTPTNQWYLQATGEPEELDYTVVQGNESYYRAVSVDFVEVAIP